MPAGVHFAALEQPALLAVGGGAFFRLCDRDARIGAARSASVPVMLASEAAGMTSRDVA